MVPDKWSRYGSSDLKNAVVEIFGPAYLSLHNTANNYCGRMDVPEEDDDDV